MSARVKLQAMPMSDACPSPSHTTDTPSIADCAMIFELGWFRQQQ
jgi:hypothetical protein